jgi:hypothetical protein
MRAGNPRRPVDQTAIEIADFKAQRPLAEIPGFRVGDLVPGQVENTDIHRRDADIGLFARCQPGDLDRNRRMRHAGFVLIRQVECDLQLPARPDLPRAI